MNLAGGGVPKAETVDTSGEAPAKVKNPMLKVKEEGGEGV